MQPGLFRDRREAGRLLAEKLAGYANRPDVIVLALPRGGVPVGYEVSRALGAPLDVFLVRKLGVPGYEELAMGAVATGGLRVINEQIVERLGIPGDLIDAAAAREQQELARRERLYRDRRPPAAVRGHTVILVDDGLATGASMHAAIAALRQLRPARIVVAVPTASPQSCKEMRVKADDVICATTPEPFDAVGRGYQDFTQTSDEEVRALLAGRDTPGEQWAPTPTDSAFLEALRARHPLTGTARDYDPLMDRIGEARFALLGEASHGTHEFYRERAEITKRLINEKGFAGVAVEADWPDAYTVNRYVRGASDAIDAVEALSDFRRFPTWMWRNKEVVEFIEWLRAHNDARPAGAAKVGFYGLDLYSMHASMKAVLRYLEKVDQGAAQRARERYSCFDHFGEDTQVYGLMTRLNLSKSCQEEVVGQLAELQGRAVDYAQRDARLAEDDLFYAEQNARLVKNAETYYRSMFLEEVSSWNLRDRHMVETLGRWSSISAGTVVARRSPFGRTTRRLGAQLASRRRARHRDGPARGAQCRAARARKIRQRCRSGWLHHAPRHGDGSSRLGRTGRAQACSPGACGQLRGDVPCLTGRPLPPHLERDRGNRATLARSQARAGDRGCLSAGYRAPEPLFPIAAAGSVRRGVAF
jgi:predicted phosphoribosyltransferase